MATLGANVLTLADWAKRLDPDGKVPQIVEMLSQSNRILEDMLFMEGNLPIGHQVSVRTGLPTVAWRLLNQGVAVSKSTTAQIVEGCGNLESWSEVDCKLAELKGNVNEFRLSEAQAFIEAMNQEMASTLFYGNSSTDPEQFNGLAIRYSSLSAANGQNVISGGGSDLADSNSIWLVGWGPQSIFGIFPKGSKAGLEHENIGKATSDISAEVGGQRMRVYQDRWAWSCGIALKDWRYVVRIANLDTSALTTKSSAPDLFDLMIKAIHRIPNLGNVKPVFYMNRTVREMLDIQNRDDGISAGALMSTEIEGKVKDSFRGIPVKICDALLTTEAVVS